jgi:hypothetical protein
MVTLTNKHNDLTIRVSMALKGLKGGTDETV